MWQKLELKHVIPHPLLNGSCTLPVLGRCQGSYPNNAMSTLPILPLAVRFWLMPQCRCHYPKWPMNIGCSMGFLAAHSWSCLCCLLILCRSTMSGHPPLTSFPSSRMAFSISLNWNMAQLLAVGSTSLSVAPKQTCIHHLQSIPRWGSHVGNRGRGEFFKVIKWCLKFSSRWFFVRYFTIFGKHFGIHLCRLMTTEVCAACCCVGSLWVAHGSWTLSSMWTRRSWRRWSVGYL